MGWKPMTRSLLAGALTIAALGLTYRKGFVVAYFIEALAWHGLPAHASRAAICVLSAGTSRSDLDKELRMHIRGCHA